MKIKRGKGMPGQKYLIVKDQGVIRKLNSQVKSVITAHYIQVFGQVDITDKVDSTYTRDIELNDYDVFRALLVKAMGLSLTDYQLIPGEVQTINMDSSGPAGPGGSQIIGSMKHHASALYGPGDIVFLNKGSKHGIAPGQIMDLTIDRSIRDQRTPVTFSGYASGRLKVVKVTEKSATGVVLSSVDSLQQGDRVEGHARLSGGAQALPPKVEGSDSDGELPALDDSVPLESGDDSNLSE